MNENDELEIELESPNESVDINEENYVYINVPEEVIEELEAAIALRALITEAGAQIELAINSSTFVLTAKLKDKNGNVIYTSNGIDLPIESMIINGTYNEQTKKLILTLQSGQTIEISLADLISGLVSEDDLATALESYYTKLETYSKIETDSLINDVDSRVDRLYNSLPKGHETGTSIDINDSEDLPLAEFGLGGHSEQETTTGANVLLGTDRTVSSSSGVLYKCENNQITIENTATKNISIAINNTLLSITAGTYFVKAVGNLGGVSSLTIGGSISQVLNLDDNQEASFNLAEDSDIGVSVQILNGITYNSNFYVTLSKDSPTSEQYTGGQPSPNPNYKSEVNSVGDNVNEFDKDNVNIINAYVSSSKIASSSDARTIYMPIIGGYTYTISKIVSSRFRVGTTVNLPNINEPPVDYLNNDTGASITLTTDSTANYLCAFIYSQANDTTITLQEILDSIKIKRGTKATPYSPYGMGCASIEKCNKNILDGIELGDINSSTGSNSSSTNSVRSKNYIKYYTDKLYYLSVNGTGVSANLRFYNKNKEYIGYSSISNTGGSNFTITKATSVSDDTPYYFKFRDSTTTIPIDSNVMLSNSNDLTYTPHQSKTYIIPTQQPMRSIGEVRDDFVKQDRVWYERHKIVRRIFDGTENWIYISSSTKPFVLSIPGIVRPRNNNTTPSLFSNKYLVYAWSSDITNVNFALSMTYNEDNLRFRHIDITSLADWKAYLAQRYADGNPVYVDYITTNEPLLLPCTNEQIEVLDEIVEDGTYKEVTHYFSEDEIEPVLDVTYYQDWKIKLDDIEARLALLE